MKFFVCFCFTMNPEEMFTIKMIDGREAPEKPGIKYKEKGFILIIFHFFVASDAKVPFFREGKYKNKNIKFDYSLTDYLKLRLESL